MKAKNFTCDGPGCEHVKKEVNHWFLVIQEPRSGGFLIHPWNEDIALQSGVEHACGEACLLKIISEHIKNATSERA